MFKHTKIVATIGPACANMETLLAMAEAGMNCARLNFSHGSYANHTDLYNLLRQVEKKVGQPVAVMQDLQGPKIRIGVLSTTGKKVCSGDQIIFNTLTSDQKNSNSEEVPIDFPDLHKYLKIGERLLVDDGRIESRIIKIEGNKISAEVIEGGLLETHKGINLPDSELPISSLTKKDKEDLKFGISLGVDLVAVSFVNSAQDILDTKFLIEEYQKELKITAEYPIKIIAKIERRAAVENIKEILMVADGVMVARGDMGVEMRAAEVPLIQKRIIDEANAIAKPVIVATQMLDSMQSSRRPTRAEVSDVANAVIDHADAVMLSNETAVGKHPALVVKTMTEIVLAAERSVYDDTGLPSLHKKGLAIDTAIVGVSRLLAEEVNAKLILVASLTGETGRLLSRLRPALPIAVATSTERVQRQLNLSWGINAFLLSPCRSIEELVERSLHYIHTEKLAKSGDKMIIVAGEPVGQAGNINLVEVREIK